ncbi:MAG: putative O-glycosylation ligase, exosortase A system-associated [Gammaproteobacteria bacterium]|nr:putative O-glycosylation ligase, exosortase A system-associated [Gammaproteobacteria bacterium]
MPLRDLAIISIVLLLALLALRRPWIGVMNWTWLSIMNPHRLSWGFAYSSPVAAIAAGSTLLGLMLTKERQSPFKGAPAVWLLLFFIWVTLSWLLGYDPAGDYQDWDQVMKIYLMAFVTLALLHNKHQIMAFAWVTVGSLAILAAKGGLFTVLTGGAYRVWGPAQSFIADNNHFALAAIVATPMLHFLQLRMERKWQRHLMSIVMILCVASALGSQSRGAMLALAAMGVVFWWRSSRKGAIGLIVLLCLLILLPMMPDAWWERMSTIRNYQEDGSAMGRLNAWLVAIEVARHNLFGGGMSYQYDYFYQLYGVHETIARAAHSIYFQVLGNHGFMGLFLYLGFWISAFRLAGKLRVAAKHHEEAAWAAELGAMVQVSLVGFAVGGTFLSMAYYDLPLNLVLMCVLAYKWVEGRGWETDPQGSFWEFAGLGRKKLQTRRKQPGQLDHT